MIPLPKFQFGAIFQIEKFKSDGTITYSGPEFHNLVLDCGLLSIFNYSATSMITYLNIGSGTSTPTETQTGLDNRLYTTNTLFNSTNYYNYVIDQTTTYYVKRTKIFQFNVGTCTGSISELGLSRLSNAEYFNRQLIKDAQGNPTTLVIAADEGLRITCEVRMYIDPATQLWSEVIDLDLGGATGGTVTMSNGLSTRSIAFSQFASGLQGQLSYLTWPPDKYPNNYNATNGHPFAFIINTSTGVRFYGCGCNMQAMNLSFSVNGLTGCVRPAQFITVKEFTPPPTLQLEYNRITDGTTVQTNFINGLANIRYEPSFTYSAHPAGTLLDLAFKSAFDVQVYDLPKRSSYTISSYPSIGNFSYSATAYWAPGVLGSGNQTVKHINYGYYPSLTMYRWYCNMLETAIVVADVEEFSIDLTVSWGRYTP